ncbi:MAG: site-2 protease family protein [Myxococcales bacterium]|nr:site-2 protease family protein [Myxococcales bacterium]
MNYLYAILALGLLIVLHEAGHFFVARWCGMKVYEFAIGFGPLLFQFTHKDVEYSIRAIPLGGYVRIAGMHPEEEDAKDPQGFLMSAPWKRFATIFAGPLANYITAFALFLFVFGYWGVPDRNVQIQKVAAQGKAGKLGLKPGDYVLAVDGEVVSGVPARSLGQHLSEMVQAKGEGKSVNISVQREQKAAKAAPAPAPRKAASLPAVASRPAVAARPVPPAKTAGVHVVSVPNTKTQPFFKLVSFKSRQVIELSALDATNPLTKSGLHAGDVILKIAGEDATEPNYLLRYLQGNPKESVKMVIRRGATLKTLSLAKFKDTAPLRKGLVIQGQDELLINEVKIEGHKLGFRQGDRVLAVDGKALVARPGLSPNEQLNQLLAKGEKKDLKLVLVRGEKRTDVKWPKGLRVSELGWQLRPTQWVLVMQTLGGSVARKIGMKAGDRIVSIEGAEISTIDQLLAALRIRIYKEINIQVERKGKRVMLKAPPAEKPADWKLGFQPQLDFPLARSGLAEASTRALAQTWSWNVRIWEGLSRIFRGKEKANLTGPVGIVKMANQAVRQGAFFFLIFVSVISIHLAFFNLLPIPALDGGRIVFLVLQQGFRAAGVDEKWSLKIETYAHIVGFVLIFSLLIWATAGDIRGLFSR